jgi:two-component system cell cycle sensor histidine kinase/response regulator CckA
MPSWLDQELFTVTGWEFVFRAVLALFMVAAIGVLVFWLIIRIRRYYQAQNTRIRAQLAREAAFSNLGNQLNAATTRRGAAKIIMETAQELFGWDASTLKLYDEKNQEAESLINYDTIDGKVQTVEPPARDKLISPIMQKVFREGPQLILRDQSSRGLDGAVPFGDKTRLSASLMFVPIRTGTLTIGMLSIQSYKPQAYSRQQLELLQKLADHCGGAVERIRAQEMAARTHDELERRVAERTTELASANELLREEIERHQRTEAALGKEQHLLQSFMETVPDSIYFKDRAGHFIRVNNEKLLRFKLTDERQILGKTDFAFFEEESARKMQEDENQIIDTGCPIIGKEEHIKLLDGSSAWMLTTKMPLRNESGAIIGTFGITRDVTRQKQAELALGHSQHLLQTIMNHVPDYIYFKDLQGRFMRVNTAFANQFGNCEPDQMIGKTDFNYLNEEAAKESFEDEQCIIRTGQPMLGKEEHEAWLDGREWWVLTSKMPFRDEHRNIVGTFGVTRDITQRKKAEEALQRSQQELERRVQERTSELTSANERLLQEIGERIEAELRSATFSNLGFALSSVTTSENAAKTILEVADQLMGWDSCYLHLFTSSSPPAIDPVLAYDIIDGKRTLYRDRPGVPLSGRDKKIIESGAELILRATIPDEASDLVAFGDDRRSLSLMFVPIRHSTRVIGAMSIQSYSANAYNNHDLATLQALGDFCSSTLERIKAQEALRISEERFSKAFVASPVPLSLSTLHEGRYLDVNDRMLQLLGHSRGEMIGKTSLELGIWPTPESRAKMVEAVEKARTVRDLDVDLQTKDGQLRKTLLSVELMDLGGESIILVGIYDLTDRLLLEERLRQSQKMEAVGQLAAGVAHDFNNILTIIQGHSTLLLEVQGLAAWMHEALEQVNIASNRAANLTKQLLAFSRKQVMQPAALELNEIVANTSKMLQRILGESISLYFNYSPTLPAVYADAGMLEQVLVNLALNSRDAMPKGGRLVISTDSVTIEDQYVQRRPEARTGQFIRLCVEDTGSGMEPEIISRIFEPFFTTKEVGKGTGLGLSTVYGIVKQHQGWIEVSSLPGVGTTFRIFLPTTTKVPQQTREPAPPPEVSGGQETILIVEDEPALRELVKSILQMYGYRVLEAAHGKEALVLWRENKGKIDLLLTDMVMPEGISGLELAEMLKKDDAGLRVIYTSGYSVDLFKERHDLTEGTNFIAKPYQPRLLAQAIRTCLDL